MLQSETIYLYVLCTPWLTVWAIVLVTCHGLLTGTCVSIPVGILATCVENLWKLLYCFATDAAMGILGFLGNVLPAC